MKDMYKDWAFWKPIVIMSSGTISYFLLLFVLPKIFAMIVAGLVFGASVIGMLFWLGKSSYELRQSQIKRNYKKLTGEEYNE